MLRIGRAVKETVNHSMTAEKEGKSVLHLTTVSHATTQPTPLRLIKVVHTLSLSHTHTQMHVIQSVKQLNTAVLLSTSSGLCCENTGSSSTFLLLFG